MKFVAFNAILRGITAKVANLVRLAKIDMKRLIRLIPSMSKRYQVRVVLVFGNEGGGGTVDQATDISESVGEREVYFFGLSRVSIRRCRVVHRYLLPGCRGSHFVGLELVV